MTTVSIHEAQATLGKLIARVSQGDEVLITQNNEPVARLVAATAAAQRPRKLGTMHGTVLHVSPDFDAPLDDFEEYMQ